MEVNNINEGIFKIKLQNKLYELYPYSSIDFKTVGTNPVVCIEMFYYWKGERIGLRHEVLLVAIDNLGVDNIIRYVIGDIQREITSRILERRL